MHGFDVNWLAVPIAALAKFAIGGVWYSPAVFGPRIRVSFFLWLGFVATPLISTTVYEGRPMALFGINASYWLVSMLVMGAIIGVM
jgi:hypothetical protein